MIMPHEISFIKIHISKYSTQLEFPQTVIQKGICLPKEQSADFLKNSEWQFCD